MAFSEAFLTELADRNDIVDVVGSYVHLGKKSGANLFGLCPFHSEKTPSFSVSPDKQIYHCFGCGKGGGVISFVMEIEGLSFPEAVEFLAKRAGMPMPEQENDREAQRRSRMLALNKEAARFFHSQLKAPSGARGQEYMAGRKITPATATSFGLGYAPDSWDTLRLALKAKGYTDQELLDADLVRAGKSGSYYDTFRNRLMFPVIDVRGNVIGFSGRILGDGEPKYLNTKETLVFNKGKNLFALNLAKKSKSGYILLVEGNVDVVSLHQAGFDSAVASLGTSLTPEQARLISRYTGEVILAYDNDGAGAKASQRAIGILEKLDLKTRLLRWEGAKDPDEYIKSRGAGAFRSLIERSESQIDYRLMNIRSRYDLDIPEQKVDYLKEATRLIASFPGSVERQVYSIRVAEAAGVSSEAVIKEAEGQRKRLLNGAQRDTERDSRPEVIAQPTERGMKYSDLGSAVAEEGVIRLLYLEPSLAPTAESSLKAEDFTSEPLRHIYAVLLARIREQRSVSADVLAEELSKEEISLLVRLLQKPENLSASAQTLQDYISAIRAQKERTSGKVDLLALAQAQKEKGKAYKA